MWFELDGDKEVDEELCVDVCVKVEVRDGSGGKRGEMEKGKGEVIYTFACRRLMKFMSLCERCHMTGCLKSYTISFLRYLCLNS